MRILFVQKPQTDFMLLIHIKKAASKYHTNMPQTSVNAMAPHHTHPAVPSD